MAEKQESYNSRQLATVILGPDAERLLAQCRLAGGVVHSVLTTTEHGFTYWGPAKPGGPSPTDSPPEVDTSIGVEQIWKVRFGDISAKPTDSPPTIELDFCGPELNGDVLVLKPGRVYCSLLSMQNDLARNCWMQLDAFIRKAFKKHSEAAQSPRGKPIRLTTYVGPEAQRWLAEPGRVLKAWD